MTARRFAYSVQKIHVDGYQFDNRCNERQTMKFSGHTVINDTEIYSNRTVICINCFTTYGYTY